MADNGSSNGSSDSSSNGSPLIELKLLGLQVQIPSESRLMLLREISGEERVLPVVIDDPEAQAIYRGIEGIEMPRPLTHDLMQNILDELDVDVERVTITEISERTFYAEIELKLNGTLHVISARPSDAIAIAVRSSATIFASRAVMDEAGQQVELHPVPEKEDLTEAERQQLMEQQKLVDDFRTFLSDLSADDFDQTDSDQTDSDQTDSDQTDSDQTDSDQTDSD